MHISQKNLKNMIFGRGLAIFRFLADFFAKILISSNFTNLESSYKDVIILKRKLIARPIEFLRLIMRILTAKVSKIQKY